MAVLTRAGALRARMRAAATQLEGIPAEIWFELCGYLEPHEILALSHVSRGLRRILAARSLWGRIIKRLCQELNLFRPSFPVETMDIADLKRVACRPSLWKRQMSRSSAPPKELEHRNMPEPRSSVSLAEIGDGPGKHWFLVPGGRFVLTMPKTIPGMKSDYVVELWDLGMPGGAPGDPVFLAKGTVWTRPVTRKREDYLRVLGKPLVSVQTEVVRVAVLMENREERTISVTVLEVSFRDQAPAITQIASVLLQESVSALDSECMKLHGDCVYFANKEVFIVWNFIRATSFTRYISLPNSPNDGNTVLTTPYFLFQTPKELWGWSVPSQDKFVDVLNSRVYLPHGPRTPSPPEFKVSHPIRASDHSPQLVFQQGSHSVPVLMDVFMHLDSPEAGPRTTSVERYALTAASGASGSAENSPLQLSYDLVLKYRIPSYNHNGWRERTVKPVVWNDPYLRRVIISSNTTLNGGWNRCVYFDVGPSVPNQGGYRRPAGYPEDGEEVPLILFPLLDIIPSGMSTVFGRFIMNRESNITVDDF